MRTMSARDMYSVSPQRDRVFRTGGKGSIQYPILFELFLSSEYDTKLRDRNVKCGLHFIPIQRMFVACLQ